MLTLKRTLPVLFIGVATLLSGCGEPPPPVYPVEGTVTLDGQPLSQIRVEFVHQDQGAQFAASTDDQGRFVLMSSDGTTPGAIGGKYKVVLRDETTMKVKFAGRENEDVDTSQGAKSRINTMYSSITKTPLEYEITREDKNVAFEVQPYEG